MIAVTRICGATGGRISGKEKSIEGSYSSGKHRYKQFNRAAAPRGFSFGLRKENWQAGKIEVMLLVVGHYSYIFCES